MSLLWTHPQSPSTNTCSTLADLPSDLPDALAVFNLSSRINWSCLLPPLVVRPKDANGALLHTRKVKRQGNGRNLQALCQRWSRAAPARRWLRIPRRNRKERKNKCRCLLHVPQDICLEVHLLLYVFQVQRKKGLCRKYCTQP